MSFWIRHTVLLLLCVLVPFSAAVYLDTTSTVERAKETSRRSLQLASESLQSMLQNEAHRSVSMAMSTARRILHDDKLVALTRDGARAETAAQNIITLLNEVTPRRGFAWLVDGEGRVLLTNGGSGLDESPRSIRGHPVFHETQLGYALDAVWSSHEALVEVAGAPLVDEGQIMGAILLGRTIDRETLSEWATALRGHITLASQKKVVVSSAPEALAKTVVEAAFDAVTPVYAGESERSLTDESFSFLPLLLDHRATGSAFISIGSPLLGAPNKYQWVISVDATEGLGTVAERQSVILGGMIASFLLALLIGILNYRSYVVPNDLVAEHLSELQMGRGDLELPEASVSRPFRRLVRLINMTVQKIPNRGLAMPTADIGSITRPPTAAMAAGVPVDNGPVGEGVAFSDTPPPALEGEPLPAPEPIESHGVPFAPPTRPVHRAPPTPPTPAELRNNGMGFDADAAAGGGHFDSLRPVELQPLPGSEFQLPTRSSERRPGGLEAMPQAEAAVADALAQLEDAIDPPSVANPVELRSPSAASRRSAADIRGRPMGSRPPEAGPFEDMSAPSGPPLGVRGGGSLDLNQAVALPDADDDSPTGFGPEETVVAPVASELLAQSAREDLTGRHTMRPEDAAYVDEKPDATVVANVPADLLAQSAGDPPTPAPAPAPRAASLQLPGSLDPDDRAHFKEVYERFIDLRRRCGESTSDLAFERFLAKLRRNRENLVKKYNCRTVRFQVYKKDGKAALKATPVGSSR